MPSLLEVFGRISDPRSDRGKRYSLPGVLCTVFLALVSGANSLRQIAVWSGEQRWKLSERLGFRRGRMPGYNAIRDLLLALDVAEVEGALRYLIASVTVRSDGKGLQGLAIDGKTLRGSGEGEGAALRLLSAVVHEKKWVLAQQAIPACESEQGVLRDFLSQADLAGYVVTVDALHTQREVAETIIQKGGTISCG